MYVSLQGFTEILYFRQMFQRNDLCSCDCSTECSIFDECSTDAWFSVDVHYYAFMFIVYIHFHWFLVIVNNHSCRWCLLILLDWHWFALIDFPLFPFIHLIGVHWCHRFASIFVKVIGLHWLLFVSFVFMHFHCALLIFIYFIYRLPPLPPSSNTW